MNVDVLRGCSSSLSLSEEGLLARLFLVFLPLLSSLSLSEEESDEEEEDSEEEEEDSESYSLSHSIRNFLPRKREPSNSKRIMKED